MGVDFLLLYGLPVVKWKWNEKMSCALREKWNLETSCSDKWTCSVTESCSVFGQTGSDWPVPDYLWLVIPGTDTIKLLDMDNCIQFVKSHWNPMIVLKLPWPGYLICLYLVLQHLFPASPLMIRLGGLFGGRRHACVMLDRLFIRLCVQALWWCYRLLNGALSANNGEQCYSECSRTKPSFLIKGLEYSQSDLTAFSEGNCQTWKRERQHCGGRRQEETRRKNMILWPAGCLKRT